MNEINITDFKQKEIYTLADTFLGTSADGSILDFTNYYMRINGKPFMGISGEMHFSRVNESKWEETILKMKMGGVNILSTYVFWIHHEETEGRFDFTGNKNLRKFIELCRKHDMYVILRIGPFDHGEVRNGGMPDWVLGKPYDVRCASDGFMAQTKLLYDQIGRQVEGLLFKDGGPIIATQLENEYMHSSAPWEITYGSTDEWIDSIRDENYIPSLKALAKEAGIDTPFYTGTAWGGAMAPTDEVMPLWGGYAYMPWIFLNYKGEHPLTGEYIYRDYHNNEMPKAYNFEPAYEPESMPYACCEMGGGMNVTYLYRFKVDPESVDAMANIKLAGGCNFLGYYMYCGGSNPKGEKAEFMNEGQCPKITYDFQAPIGEFGQVRESYKRLKCIHLFMTNFGECLADLKTVLPDNAANMEPSDIDSLRYAVRTDGRRGFVFINNYQDHAANHDFANREILIKTKHEEIIIDGIDIAAKENAILPFNLSLGGGITLKWGRIQPLSVIEETDKITYFFYAPNGMTPKYVFDIKTGKNDADADGVSKIYEGNTLFDEEIVLTGEDNTKSKEIHIVTLLRQQALDFYEYKKEGKKEFIISEEDIIIDDGKITFTRRTDTKEADYTQCGYLKYEVTLPDKEEIAKQKDIIMSIDYIGDVGQAFINGHMVADNYYNGNKWEIGLKEINERLNGAMGTSMVIRIVPIKKDRGVDTSSVMAGRMEIVSEKTGELKNISFSFYDTFDK